jgi:starch synthase
VLWAVEIYYKDKAAFKDMQERAMKKHFSWDDSAKSYEAVYRYILNRHNTPKPIL